MSVSPFGMGRSGMARTPWAACLAAAAAFVAGLPNPAVAVIITRDATGNTSAPTDPALATRWGQVGNFDVFMGTPIASQFFLTAKHLGNLTGQPITFPDTSTFSTIAGFFDPDSDLAIYQIAGSFPNDKIVPMYSGSFVANQSMYLFGRGVPRTTTDVVGNAFGGGTEAKGWTWGSNMGTRSWGTNTFNQIIDDPDAGPQIAYDFDYDGTGTDEGILSIGDSGGPVFMQEGGVWKLAGIHYAVETPFNTTDFGDGFNAAVFDKGGLYERSDPNTWTYLNPTPGNQPAFSYSTSVPAGSAWIASIVPEPATGSIVGLAAIAWLLRRRRRTA